MALTGDIPGEITRHKKHAVNLSVMIFNWRNTLRNPNVDTILAHPVRLAYGHGMARQHLCKHFYGIAIGTRRCDYRDILVANVFEAAAEKGFRPFVPDHNLTFGRQNDRRIFKMGERGR